MFAAIAAWFTPTVLFCFMNLVIATIFLSHKKPDPTRPQTLLQRVRSINLNPYNSDPTHNPTRTPSFIERVRSINFPPYDQNPPQDPTRNPTRTPSLIERVGSINFSLYDQNPAQDLAQDPTQDPSSPERVQPDPTRPIFSLHRSESEPAELKIRRPDPSFKEAVAAPSRMRKSASVRTIPAVAAETEEVRRPATVREKKTGVYGEDDKVDEKADDFINKFKNQLKLQRLDSILRYKEMLNRGASR